MPLSACVPLSAKHRRCCCCFVLLRLSLRLSLAASADRSGSGRMVELSCLVKLAESARLTTLRRCCNGLIVEWLKQLDFVVAEAAAVRPCGGRRLSMHYSRPGDALQSSRMRSHVANTGSRVHTGSKCKSMSDDNSSDGKQEQNFKKKKASRAMQSLQNDAPHEGAADRLWQLPAGRVVDALMVPCELEPDFNTTLIQRVCDSVPDGREDQASVVVRYVLCVKNMLNVIQKLLKLRTDHGNGIAQLLGVKAQLFDVRELDNARKIMFTGSPERAHAAAYVSGFTITASANASRKYDGKGTRNKFVPVETPNLYFAVANSLDEYMERWARSSSRSQYH
eukprot:jgi/Chlat1/2450/Chrsp171S02349